MALKRDIVEPRVPKKVIIQRYLHNDATRCGSDDRFRKREVDSINFKNAKGHTWRTRGKMLNRSNDEQQ
jgi:hypothetical protein